MVNLSEKDVESESGNLGNVGCSAEYTHSLTEFSKFFSGHKQAKGEAARFAMAIGIQTNKKIFRKDWKKIKGKKPTNIASWSGFSTGFDLENLFIMLDLEEEEHEIHEIASAYVTGGLKWIVENDMLEGKNFSEMKEQIPHLFTD